MSIPLDRLYHYIEGIAKKIRDDVLIYRFYPHGSKKLEDLNALDSNMPLIALIPITISIYCNDQEPLNYDLYRDNSMHPKTHLPTVLTNIRKYNSIYDKVILLHSEKNSNELVKYTNDNFILSYYWSHAIIALDWFRYARYEEQVKKVKKSFLIYNRAWANTREYRLKFMDLLIENNLINYCITSVAPIDSSENIHYSEYQFKNQRFAPTNILENYIQLNTAESHYSADYTIEDYNLTDFEVVLETLFDDERWHLTEKILRPIACGQPFILASTCGALSYLQSYGFKTFANIINEDYDSIKDPVERLNAIILTMKDIISWSPEERTIKLEQIKKIVEYNKKYFFSDEFFNKVTTELTDNLHLAIETIEKTNTSSIWINRRKALNNTTDIKSKKKNLFIDGKLTRLEILALVKKARSYYRRTLPKD